MESIDLTAGPGALGSHEVMRMLAHRHPFLFVDKILRCAPGASIVGIKNISHNEPALGRNGTAFPRLLLIEALAQVSVILTYKTLGISPNGKELMFFAGIDEAKFDGDARVGDTLVLRSSIYKLRKSMGWFRADASIDCRPVASMSMLAAITRPSDVVTS
jgi:3-hydroxyacyl-[acyl-carrier-protein] dehydratase